MVTVRSTVCFLILICQLLADFLLAIIQKQAYINENTHYCFVENLNVQKGCLQCRGL